MTPILLNNFFPPDLYAALRKAVQAVPMSYGSKSNGRTDPHGHWSWKPVHDDRKNLADLTGLIDDFRELAAGWRFLLHHKLTDWSGLSGEGSGKTYKLIRCYANGYTYGTDGYFHTDSDQEGDLTVILYICDEWQMDWAGETVVSDGKTYWAYLPSPNRVLIIPSNMLHAARSVSRKCTSLRTTLMWKARPARSVNFESLSAFLTSNGALSKQHSKGTLHDHLMRVFALLEPRSTETVSIGGGLHSIYGTNAFKGAIFSATPDNRAMVAEAFGGEAESRAYEFFLADRPKTFDRDVGQEAVAVKLRYDSDHWVANQLFRDLQLIECANLADQGSLDKWPNLKRLWEKSNG